MDDLMGVYIDDMKEYLTILNESIIALEKHTDEESAVNEMFRAYHTMKSSTAAMEFKRTADFIHHMEDLLFEVREGRLVINQEIIKTLFESYDILEIFLNNIIGCGNEGDLEYDRIIGVVKEYIDQNNVSNKAHVSGTGSGLGNDGNLSDELILKTDELERAKSESAQGRQIFRITVTISQECSFKSVRTWMVFEDISKQSIIIGSIPQKPMPEDFKNGSFVFEGTKLQIVAASDISIDDFIQELCSSQNELDQIIVEEIKPEFTGIMKFNQLQPIPGEIREYRRSGEKNVNEIVDEIIGKGAEPSSCVADENSLAIAEIEKTIINCELRLLELESTQYSIEGLNDIVGMLGTVCETSCYSGCSLLKDISDCSYNLAKSMVDGEIGADIVTIGLLVDFITYIKRLCKDINLENDNNFNNEIKNKRAFVNNYIKTASRGSASGCGEKAKLGEILVQNGAMKKDDVDEVVNLQKENYPNLKFGQIAVKENKVAIKDVINALHVQENTKSELHNQSYIRVPANKIDNLVDYLSELLITQSLHKQEISNLLGKDSGNLLNNIVRMERIAKELQDITMSLRMVSLKQTFQKIYRIGRDTAAELGKDVNIEVFGDETEIDRNVVDKIHDPLMHLIRNCISHGIEEKDERIAKGKTAQGHVILQACNKRGIVYIEIRDDGKGLSIDKIYKKALEKDLIDSTKKYNDEEITKFIFLPGFSTAEKIDNISGRGVGLNVVQTEITKLGGKVDVENRPGNGCSFILKIPVNLATINGTVVEISGSNYIIPTLNIRQMLKPQDDQWVSIKGKTAGLVFRNEIIPIIPINAILHTKMTSEELRSALVVVVEHEQKLMALPVQNIIGKQEVVVKQIGSDFSKLSYLSGATILGDGRVSLILDAEALYKFTDDTAEAWQPVKGSTKCK